ncbi:outer membrane lipoprotein-sorting protein [candidate division KSB1 bacterium]
MKTLKKLILILMAPIFFSTSLLAQDAKEIIKKADDKSRGLSSKGEMSMTIIRPKWTRKVTMKTWSKGSEYFLIYVKSPQKDAGQVFLKREKEMWNWIPSIERTIKIPPSMMMQSWMGSDFTNDDLVQESSIVKDYNHKLLGTETVREKECYKIELKPKPDAPVVWGKIISWITKDGYDQWKALYYDEDGYLVNSENSYNIKKMDDRSIPTKIEIIPAGKKGQKTVLEFTYMQFNITLEESFFSQQNMKKIR